MCMGMTSDGYVHRKQKEKEPQELSSCSNYITWYLGDSRPHETYHNGSNKLLKLTNILQVAMCKVNYKACVFYELLYIFLLLGTTTIIVNE